MSNNFTPDATEELRKFGESLDKAKQYETEAENRGVPRVLAGVVAYLNGDKGAANVIFAREAYNGAKSALAKLASPFNKNPPQGGE